MQLKEERVKLGEENKSLRKKCEELEEEKGILREDTLNRAIVDLGGVLGETLGGAVDRISQLVLDQKEQQHTKEQEARNRKAIKTLGSKVSGLESDLEQLGDRMDEAETNAKDDIEEMDEKFTFLREDVDNFRQKANERLDDVEFQQHKSSADVDKLKEDGVMDIVERVDAMEEDVEDGKEALAKVDDLEERYEDNKENVETDMKHMKEEVGENTYKLFNLQNDFRRRAPRRRRRRRRSRIM